jgi:hypothetical protein
MRSLAGMALLLLSSLNVSDVNQREAHQTISPEEMQGETMSTQPLARRQDHLAGPETFNVAAFSLSCLASDSYFRIPVRAGQRYQISASISSTCDSRGWSPDNWSHSSGPKGVSGWYVNGSLGHPNAPIGMLIGAISPIDIGSSMTKDEAVTVFTNNVLLIGSHYDAVSPLDGFLYLMYNDTWAFGDNKGSVGVEIFLF